MTYEPAMSFVEIGQRMGLNTTHVYRIYEVALPKLKAGLIERGIRFEDLQVNHTTGSLLGDL